MDKVISFLAVCAVVFVGFCFGLMGGASVIEKGAVSSGVAEYFVSEPSTGKTEFRFIQCEGE